jgi:hypothetical protein
MSTPPYQDLQPGTSHLVIGLAKYLEANPNASDTLEGICMWWLGGQSESAEIQDALDFLVGAGLVERVFAMDGRCRYRRSMRSGDMGSVASAELEANRAGLSCQRLQ